MWTDRQEKSVDVSMSEQASLGLELYRSPCSVLVHSHLNGADSIHRFPFSMTRRGPPPSPELREPISDWGHIIKWCVCGFSILEQAKTRHKYGVETPCPLRRGNLYVEKGGISDGQIGLMILAISCYNFLLLEYSILIHFYNCFCT